MIAERGLHDTPMSLIVKHSGASAGTIYHYFTDKDDLIRALYKYVKTKFDAALVAGYSSELPHAEAFRQMWRNAYNFYYTHNTEAKFLDQYENSPYYELQLPPAGVMEEIMPPELFKLSYGDGKELLIKNLPLDALYEMTFGVAARVAKHRRAANADLDDPTLNSIADSCYNSVML